mgnify:CR=1 FL=1
MPQDCPADVAGHRHHPSIQQERRTPEWNQLARNGAERPWQTRRIIRMACQAAPRARSTPRGARAPPPAPLPTTDDEVPGPDQVDVLTPAIASSSAWASGCRSQDSAVLQSLTSRGEEGPRDRTARNLLAAARERGGARGARCADAVHVHRGPAGSIRRRVGLGDDRPAHSKGLLEQLFQLVVVGVELVHERRRDQDSRPGTARAAPTAGAVRKRASNGGDQRLLGRAVCEDEPRVPAARSWSARARARSARPQWEDLSHGDVGNRPEAFGAGPCARLTRRFRSLPLLLFAVVLAVVGYGAALDRAGGGDRAIGRTRGAGAGRDPAGHRLYIVVLDSPSRSEVDAIPASGRSPSGRSPRRSSRASTTSRPPACARRSRVGRASPVLSVLEDFTSLAPTSARTSCRTPRRPACTRRWCPPATCGAGRVASTTTSAWTARRDDAPKSISRSMRRARPRPRDPSRISPRHRQPSQAHAQGPLRAGAHRDERVPGGPRGRACRPTWT